MVNMAICKSMNSSFSRSIADREENSISRVNTLSNEYKELPLPPVELAANCRKWFQNRG